MIEKLYKKGDLVYLASTGSEAIAKIEDIDYDKGIFQVANSIIRAIKSEDDKDIVDSSFTMHWHRLQDLIQYQSKEALRDIDKEYISSIVRYANTEEFDLYIDTIGSWQTKLELPRRIKRTV